MADIHDLLNAEQQTDEALEAVHALGGRAEDSASDSTDLSLAVLLGATAIVKAIRAAAIRNEIAIRNGGARS